MKLSKSLLSLVVCIVFAHSGISLAANDVPIERQSLVPADQRRILFSADEHPGEVTYLGRQADPSSNQEHQHEVEYPHLTAREREMRILPDLILEAGFHPGYGEEIDDAALGKKVVSIYATPELSRDGLVDATARVIVLGKLLEILEGRVSSIEQSLRMEPEKSKGWPLPQIGVKRKAWEQIEAIRLAKQRIKEQKSESARLVREASAYRVLIKDITKFRDYLRNWYQNPWVGSHLEE